MSSGKRIPDIMLPRNFISSLFLIALWAVSTTQIRAQQYDLLVLNNESGLRGVQINDITQDSLGYLWVATDDGVGRFDGLEFVNYYTKHGLSENYCTTIFCDRQQRIWVGHQTGGISIIGKDSVTLFTEENGLANNEVHDIFQDSDGKIWVATFGGVSIFDGENWTTKTTSDGLISNNIKTISEDENGAIWLGTFGSGINILNGDRIELAHRGNGLINNHVTNLLFKDERMLIGTLGGIGAWKNNSFNNVVATDERINSQINDISINSNGDLWLATYNGAIRIRQEKKLRLTEANGLPDNEVLCVFHDTESNTWLGTHQGLVKVKNLAFAHYSSSDELDIDPHFLFIDSKGILWAANESGGVLKFDGNTFETAFTDPDINDHQISSIAEDRDENLWFGTMDFGGLFQWDGKKLYIYSDEFGLADNNINCLLKDAKGNLLIGTPSGLSSYDGVDFSKLFLSDDFASNNISSMELATDGTVWIGATDGSVFLLRDGQADAISIPATSAITDICQSKQGIVLTTQTDGIFMLKEGKLELLKEDDASGNSVAQSVVSVKKNLYIGTSHGLKEMRFIGDSITTHLFSKINGFIGRTCKMGAMLFDGENLWVGTGNGITRFAPTEQQTNKKPPSSFLTDLQLNYQKVDWQQMGFGIASNGLPQQLQLSYTENTLRFFFKGIDHSHPELVSYKWMLEGLETDWNPPSHQEMANYPSLPPNDYTFKLITCNNNGICSPPITFSFTIRPPFWQTTGFYVVFVLGMLALAYLYIKRRERVLLQEKQVLESTVQKRTKQLREQKEIVEAQNHHITEGIEYASNIQKAILPSEQEMNAAFKEHFVFYRPKETVGGDFYWAYQVDGISWAAAVDCTGHGVSGAFMSMIGSDLLNQIIIEKKINDPAQVLDEMDKGIKLAFAQSAKEFESDQGMDVSLIRIDKKSKTMQFAGAQRPLFMFVDGNLSEIEGDRFSISCADEIEKTFKTHDLKYKDGSTVFLFSDGITDQFGGAKEKKFMVRRIREFLVKNNAQSMKDQHAAIIKTFDDWKGAENNQIDDVMLMGIRL
ncbi:MAG: SpoIIE family protein phosphatase [Flavobacteriales bacterium]|nr:SpoIIE family protein phosphatase [Flavobacteriales bacterium]